jgi:hypothetical protein
MDVLNGSIEAFIGEVLKQTTALGIALLIIYWNRQDTRERGEADRQQQKERSEADREEQKERLVNEREDKKLLIGALERSSGVLAELSNAVRSMDGHLMAALARRDGPGAGPAPGAERPPGQRANGPAAG